MAKFTGSRLLAKSIDFLDFKDFADFVDLGVFPMGILEGFQTLINFLTFQWFLHKSENMIF